MNRFEEVAPFSPLPIVDKNDIAAPLDGVQTSAPVTCERKFRKSDKCRKHYEKIAQGGFGSRKEETADFVQCPFGFSSFVADEDTGVVMTGFIPYPRMGGGGERAMAKKHPDVKMTRESVVRAADSVLALGAQLESLKAKTVRRQSVALHETRKLNSTIKQNAERLCREQSPENPDDADKKLVDIWKSSDLMSQQFRIIELLANENLAQLPLNSSIDVYRIFDKCARIYEERRESVDVKMIPTSKDEQASVGACDKTLPIIPTVLIENAVKYSISGSEVRIYVDEDKNSVTASVSNLADASIKLDDDIFEKGYRASDKREGSGNGLFIARLVASQHKARIYLETEKLNSRISKHKFSVRFPILDKGSVYE